MFSKAAAGAAPQDGADPAARPGPRPAQVCYAIGDIHGCAQLLEDILTLIDQDIGAHKVTEPALIFTGNYMGYGPCSLDVVERLQELRELFPRNVVCLLGSQERLLLDMLADPDRRAARWLGSGGDRVLHEMAARASSDETPPAAEDADGLAAYLRAGLGGQTLAWLSELPLSWSSGNLWVVHAGADPLRPMPDQSPRILLWGHPEFLSAGRPDDIWIAHGHSPVTQAGLTERRIAVNTQAYQTGRLSAAAITPEGAVRVMATGSEGQKVGNPN